MIIEPCCPGRTSTKKILIGEREVGIIGLDEILWKCIELGEVPDEARRELLLRELKRRNYVPRGAEKEYEEGIWKEFLAVRDVLLSVGRRDCSCCNRSEDEREGCC